MKKRLITAFALSLALASMTSCEVKIGTSEDDSSTTSKSTEAATVEHIDTDTTEATTSSIETATENNESAVDVDADAKLKLTKMVQIQNYFTMKDSTIQSPTNITAGDPITSGLTMNIQADPQVAGDYYALQWSGDTECIVAFGEVSKYSVSDIAKYAPKGEMINYVGIGTETDGVKYLFPIIYGSDSMGYYVVPPVIDTLGMDLSKVISDINSSASDNGGTTVDPVADNSGNSGATDISSCISVKTIFDNLMEVNFTNPYDTKIYTNGVKIYLNGKDVGATSSNFNCEAGETKTISVVFKDSLVPGDVVTLEGTFLDYNGSKELDNFQFELDVK